MRQRRHIIPPYNAAARSLILLALVIPVTVAWGAGRVRIGTAQTNDNLWGEPTNLSRSGAASSPALSVAPDGSVHALWWDTIAGMQYSSSGITVTAWSTPTVASQVFGERRQSTDPTTGATSVTLFPPVSVRPLADAADAVKVFWIDTTGAIRYSRLAAGRWTQSRLVAQSAVTFEARRGLSDTVHLAYARSIEAKGSPAGIYYVYQSREVPKASLVYSSLYFRTANAGDLQLSLAADDRQNVVVLWEDARFGVSYARSSDGGATWSDPQAVNAVTAGISTHPRVAVGPEGAFLLVWGEAGSGVCRVYQRRSLDGGQTWGSPEQILGGLTHCPDSLAFSTSTSTPTSTSAATSTDTSTAAGGDGRLWLIGPSGEAGLSSVTLAAWDGQQWSEPAEVALTYRTSAAADARNLGCPSVALAGDTLAAIGCDDRKDIWAMRNTVALNQLAPILKSAWQVAGAISGVSVDADPDGLPALAAEPGGRGYGIWSQSLSTSRQDTSLYLSLFENGAWQRGVEILKSPAGDSASGLSSAQAQQPSLAVDSGGKLQAVWTAGSAGAIYSSRALRADAAMASSWSQPVALPIPAPNAQWPFIAADPRGSSLYALFAVPNNEKRGIYLSTSLDGGATWLTPTTVFDAVAAGWSGVTKPRLVLDTSTDTLHAVWLRVDFLNDLAPRAVFYARSLDRGATWSAPALIADGLLDWPSVAGVGQGQVSIVWSQVSGQTQAGGPAYEISGRYSLDGGQRWSETASVLSGVDGPFGLASDNAGHMYLVAVGRRPSGESGLGLARWNGGGWDQDTQPMHGLGQTAHSGNAAAAVIVAGTGRLAVLAQVWTAQPNDQHRYTIYGGSRDVEASTLAPAPTFTPVPAFTPTPAPDTPTPAPVATQRPQVTVSAVQAGQGGLLRSQPPLVLGGVAAVVIVIFALIVIGAKRRLGR